MTLSARLRERIVEAWGEESTPELNYMADVCQIIADEMDGWTNRADNAMRIPDVIAEAGRDLRRRAAK